MGADDLALLVEAADGAARIARRHQRTGATASWPKADASPVTEADLAVDRYLRDTLLAARPDYGWLSEETPDDPAQREGRRTFIIDPIDGTRAYAAGEPGWAHSLAIAEDGMVTEAVILLPVPRRLYTARRGGGARLNGIPIAVARRSDPANASVLAARAVTEARHWRGTPPAFHRYFRPALAHRLALVAEGRYDAALTLRPAWEWDIAAGALIVAEAGGAATSPGEGAHRFNSASRQAPGFLAANQTLHDAIVAQLA